MFVCHFNCSWQLFILCVDICIHFNMHIKQSLVFSITGDACKYSLVGHNWEPRWSKEKCTFLLAINARVAKILQRYWSWVHAKRVSILGLLQGLPGEQTLCMHGLKWERPTSFIPMKNASEHYLTYLCICNPSTLFQGIYLSVWMGKLPCSFVEVSM